MDEVSIDSEKNGFKDSVDFLPFYLNSDKRSDNQSFKHLNFSLSNKNFDFLFEKKKNKITGRKTKNYNEKGLHNKYTSDNMIKKCKTVVVKILGNLINKKIKDIYHNSQKRLMKMNQEQIINSHVNYNKLFLKKKLIDIFSENLSSKCKRYPNDYNRKLIAELLNLKDKTKKKFFLDIFNLTFLDCVEHFGGSKKIHCLQDLEKLDDICENLNGDDNYKDSFRCYIENFKTIIEKKKSRGSKKSKD